MSTAQAVEDRAKFDFVRYANCWEDPLLLLGVMPPQARCLSIASAGDNSFSLLCGGAASVTAFDLNRAQLDLCELKAAAFRSLPHADFLRFLGFAEATGEERIALYRDKYIYYDFILWYSAEAERREFRQSDIISEPYFSGSKFMREWLEPIGAHFGAGLNIAQNGIAYGNVAIYRSLEEGDFSDLDMAVLGVVNEHLCTCFARLFPMGLQSGDFSAESSEIAARYHLTPREEELVSKVGLGVARRDLAAELFISENTVKRHLNSVYAKCGVRSFDELARLVAPSGRVMVVEKLVSGLGVPH